MRHSFSACFLLSIATLVSAAPDPKRPQDSLTDTAPGVATLEPVARISDKRIDECSGLAYAGGAFWANNDSGSDAVLYRSTKADFANAEAFEVPGADAIDWEDLAVLDGDILACDTGDNGRKRESVTVYRVRYLAATDDKPARVERLATYPIRYPDGAHDAEGCCVIDGKLHIVVKNRGEASTSVFRVDELKDAKDLAGGFNKPVSVGKLELEVGDQVTAADYDAETGTIVLLTYYHLLQYKKERFSGKPLKSTLLAARQCEALCFHGKQLVFTNEQRDVFAIDDYLARDYASMLPILGEASLPLVKDTFEIDGTGDAWANFRAEVPLQHRLEDEHLRWLIAGDKLLLQARLRYRGDFQSSREANGSLGSGLILMFGKDRTLELGKQEVQIAIGDNGQTGIDCWRMDLTGDALKLKPLAGCKFKGSVKGGVFEFEAAIELKSIFGEMTPDSFMFNALGWTLHGPTEVQFSGQDHMALFRPYIWGEVTIRK